MRLPNWVRQALRQGPDDEVAVRGEVEIVITHSDGTETRRKSHNIVTDAGDLYYAQRGASETPTNAFGVVELGTTGNAPGKTSNRSDVTAKVASSELAVDGTYPKTNDGDADNTGAGTDKVSYRYSYAKGVVVGTGVDRLIITNATPGASEPVMAYATFTSFDATADDTVKIYVNHEMLGV